MKLLFFKLKEIALLADQYLLKISQRDNNSATSKVLGFCQKLKFCLKHFLKLK